MRRYKHNLSYYHLTTGEFGTLIPVGWWECLPHDTWRIKTSVFTRCTPLLAPVMHPVQIRLHAFFTPTRLLDPNFEDFITKHDESVDLDYGPATQDLLDDYLQIPQLEAS